MTVSRHLSREFALQTLFSWLFWSRTKPIATYFAANTSNFFDHKEKELSFAKMIIEGVEKHYDDIAKTVEKFAPEWPFEQIATVDRCILAVGVFEILYNDDVPDVVAINEAIELAKKFGNDSSPKFANGVLNTVMHSKKK